MEVNNFNAVRITLASPEQINSWSRGEVKKPETINYRTLKPERDGLFCERIFGPTKDWECACGKYKRIRYKGIVCDKCGVEVTRAKVRRERMGHIKLASPVSHIWFVKGTPSRIGLLLDITPRVLEQVLYFAKYIVCDVNESQRRRLLEQIHRDVESRIARQERADAEQLDQHGSELNQRIDKLEKKRAELLLPLEQGKERLLTEVPAQGQEVDELLRRLRGKMAPENIVFTPSSTTIVAKGQKVMAEHAKALRDELQRYLSVAEEKIQGEEAKLSAEPDAEIDLLKGQLKQQADELANQLAQQAEAIRAGAESRIKRIEQIKLRQTLTEGELRELHEVAGRTFRAGMGAEAIRELLQNINLDELANELRGETRSSSGQRRKKATKRLRVVEAFRKSGNRPEWMVMIVLPVLPPDLRPMVQLDGGRFATSDLNDLYRRVINRNNRLKRLMEIGAPEIIVRNEKRMLQEAVDSLIDNGRRGRAVSGSSNHKLKSLSDMLKGKQGRFRQNLLGKRVDYSGRSVIVVGPELKLHQCGLPKRMALELFKPFVMRKLVDRNIAHNIKSAKRLVERANPQVWDVLEEVTADHPVLLNRAPTLHRLGIQAFEPVLVDGSAIQLHPLVCAAFNADFDGDQMAVHVPLSAPAKREAREFMQSTNNLLLPSNGEPIVAPTLDMVLGCYYLTIQKSGAKGEGKVFSDPADARLAYDLGLIALHARIQVRMEDEAAQQNMVTTTVGRLIFHETVDSVIRAHGGEPMPFQNEIVDKGGLKAIVALLIRRHGNRTTAAVLDEIKRLGFEYATRSGITIAIGDIKIPDRKQALLDEADQAVAGIERNYTRGLITDEERYNEIVAVWTTAKEDITRAVSDVLDPYGSVLMMANSGAKGNVQQIAQMAGMRGLMADPTGKIIELPIRASFRDGLSVLEYFLSTHGARKGLADTAIRTADSGYLTRRLIDVAQNVIVYDEDCQTPNGIWIEDLTDPARRQLRLDQLVGRVAATSVVEETTGEVLVDGHEVVDEDIRDRIAASGVQRIQIRSPLVCESRHGVCQRCYGWHMGTRHMVGIGDAIGIVAAQSIGEPGTQLTMRTFHTGGVAGLDITSGLPRVEELFEARVPKSQALLSEIDGVVEIQRQADSRVLRVLSRETYRDEHDLPKSARLVVNQGDSVEVGQTLAELPGGKPPIQGLLAGIVNVKGHMVIVTSEERDEREYSVPVHARILVENGQVVSAGQQLTEGAKNPQDILRVQGREAVQRYLVDEVQEVYRSQGVTINDKHIEVIVRQMLRRLQVDTPGDTELLPAELVDRFQFDEHNRQVLAQGGEPATARPVLLGITKGSLNTESFLAAASFQETTKVLTEAALSGKVDHLVGLKENVIIGKLIPAGSGLAVRAQARRERLEAQQAAQLLLGAPEVSVADMTPLSEGQAQESQGDGASLVESEPAVGGKADLHEELPAEK